MAADKLSDAIDIARAEYERHQRLAHVAWERWTALVAAQVATLGEQLARLPAVPYSHPDDCPHPRCQETF